MNGAEYIVSLLESIGVKQSFMVNGGGAMYLNDAFSKSERINVTYCHHEQACAMAAVGYSKYNNEVVVVVTSTGCGSTNAMTGLLDAWQDGNKVLFISGNVSLSDCDKVGIGKSRKYGVQGANIIELVSPITVYSNVIRRSSAINRMLSDAINKINEESGPAWLDVPMDVQAGIVNHTDCPVKYYEYIDRIRSSERPIVVAGYGIRQSNTVEQFVDFINRTGIPFVTTYLGIDYFPSDHPLNIGRLGTKGDRAGNYAVRQSDLVIILGSSLTVPVVGYGDDFGKLNILNINKDDNIYLGEFFGVCSTIEYILRSSWMYQCNVWKQQWPVFQNEYKNVLNGINIYLLLEKIHEFSHKDSVIVSDAGSVYYATSQAYRIKGNQRYITSGGQADMGFSLPAAIGAALASNKQVIALTGDGSVQMNIQELGTLAKLAHLNIKLLVVNNGGYLSIRNTANKFFGGHIRGTDENNGLKFPDLGYISDAYGLMYTKIEGGGLWQLENIFKRSGAEIVEVICQNEQEILPCAAKGHNLDDMYPFLNK